MPLPNTPEAFAGLLAATIPATAVRVDAGERAGFAWPGRGAPGSEGVLDLPVFACVDREGRPSTGLHYGTSDCDAYAGFVAWPLLRDLGLSGSMSPDATRGPPPAGSDGFARRFCAGLDYEALRLVADADAGDPDAYAWLAAPGGDGARRKAFAAAFPWAVDAMVESGRDLWDDADAEAACDLVRSSAPAGAGPQRTLRRLVEASRGNALPSLDRRAAMRGLRAASRLPANWIPDDPGALEHLVILAPHLLAHAARSGRPLGEAARPSSGWDGTVARLLAKAGLDGHPAPLPRKVSGLSVLVEDMLDAFADQVLLPAAESARVALAEDDLLRAAHRLVLGTRSYPAAVETALRWQARRTPAAEAVAAIAGRAGLSWPVPFASVGDRLGVEMACLSTPGELAEEGRALSHCVARYLPACLAGERVIVSVRRPGRPGSEPERLSTLELGPDRTGRLVPLQHRGHANAPPPDVADLAARRLAAALASNASAPFARGMGAARARLLLQRAFRDHPSEARTIWAETLGPELGGASPEQLLAAGGIEPDASPGPG
jgi:hypothetical protein